MLKPLPYKVDLDLLSDINFEMLENETKLVLNSPKGNFFYDPWTLKTEFKGTVWEIILDTLPLEIGEARIIKLSHGETYMSHSDIDDRFHLNITGQYSFLIDIDQQTMYSSVQDGQWYEMNTGTRHVAANFGSYERIQLVVRKLLNKVEIKNPKKITITPVCKNPRFEFDDLISPWLNASNKKCIMSDFKILDNGVEFNLDSVAISELEYIPKNKFEVIIE